MSAAAAGGVPATANHYVGTMLGSAASAAGGNIANIKKKLAGMAPPPVTSTGANNTRVMAVNGGCVHPPSEGGVQYIVSPESDVDPASMATHV